MPLIPRVTPNLTPDAPAPVLNQLRAPTVDRRGEMQGIGQLAAAGQQSMIPTEPFLAPGRGMEAVGDAVQGVGHVMARLAYAEQEVKTDNAVFDADLKMDTAYSEFTDGLMKDNVPTEQWEGRWKERKGMVTAEIMGNEHMTPKARRLIEQKTKLWEFQTDSKLRTNKIQLEGNQAEAAGSDSVMQAIHAGNFEMAEARIAALEPKLYMPPAKITALKEAVRDGRERAVKQEKVDLVNRRANIAVQTATTSSWMETQKLLNSPEFKAGVSATDQERIRNDAQAAHRDRQVEVNSTVADGIASGKIKTEADIDAAVHNNPFVTPDMIADQKTLLRTFNHNQAAVARSGQSGQEAFLKAYVDARNWKPDLTKPEEAAREQLQKIMNVKANVADALQGDVTDVLHEKFQSYGGKSGSKRTEIEKSVTDSITATYNQQILPYKREQTRALSEYNSYLSGDVTDPAKEKELKDKLAHADASLAKKEQDIFKADAIVQRKMNEYFQNRTNPLPNDRDVWDQLNKELPGARRVERVQSLMPGGARGAVGAPGAAGQPIYFDGARITSYGYEGDTTPDANSSAGIGAFVPDAEAVKIKSGQASDFKLREGDLAVSPDIEQSFRANGINPGDWVVLTYKDGSRHMGRWMDKTANDEQAAKLGLKPLRGRFDLYSPKGQSPRNDTAVVSYSKAS